MSVAHYFQVAFVWWTSTYLWTYLAIGWWAGSVGSFANGLMSIFLHDSGFTNLLDITDPQSITPVCLSRARSLARSLVRAAK